MVDAEIELELRPGSRQGEYAAKVLRAASGGEPNSTFELDIDALLDRSHSLETTVLASAARARGPGVPELEKPLREIGSELFRALFSGPIGATYHASLAVAHERGKKLRVVLRITAPELAVMPWEALYDDDLQAYICRTEPLVRHIDAPDTPEALPVHPPLRILGIVASPRGLPELNADAEKQRLDQALRGPTAAGQVQVHWLTDASWSSVHERLLQGEWHVLHFIGHGAYDPERGEGQIALVREDRRADWVDATSLADLLGEADPTPRLVVLNSCASGQGGSHDLFSGTAATLVHRGISAVAAMQFNVSDIAAVAFPRGFYTALARGRSVDDAVRSGRIEILGLGSATLEWVTPVLYVRGENTQLFHFTGRPPEPPPLLPPMPEGPPDLLADPRWADALNAFFAQRWTETVQRFEVLQAGYPDEVRIETRLTEARRHRDIETWLAKADAATADADWDTAVTALENLTRLDPDSSDVAARLEQARTARRRKTLVDEMTALHQARRWKAVVAAAEELARLDPDHPDPGGIVSDSHAKIAEAELADRYAQALNHLDQQHWQQAAELFAAIERDHPGYRDVAALRTTSQHKLAATKPAADNQAATPTSPPPAHERQKKTAGPGDLGAKHDLVETAEREPVPQDATTEAAPGVHPGKERGAIHEAKHERAASRIRKRLPLRPILVGAGTLAVVGVVVLTVFLIREQGPSQGPPTALTAGPYTVSATVPVGGSPRGVAVDPGAQTVYVTNEQDGTVSVIDGSTRTITATVPVSKYPTGVAVDPSTRTVYVNSDSDNTVSVIDGSTRTVTATVPVGKHMDWMVVDPGTHTVYVANEQDGTVSVIDGSTRTVTATVPVGKLPEGVAVDPGTHTVYVATKGDNKVSVIDGSTRTVTATVRVGGYPVGVAVDPSTHTVYVANAEPDGTVSAIDGSTRTVTATVPVGKYPKGVAVDPSTHTVYVINSDDNTVSVIEHR
ncbi:CHAT domain-containing protein [Nocardia vaccinii]|uniref:CHAT domain-containing protein n=1 Tax=Nocardia vaccinii TaxID=1822 RepID=UPI000B2C1C1B|nr:CHAT domain-containing protein [Nocardia vaccinii]